MFPLGPGKDVDPFRCGHEDKLVVDRNLVCLVADCL